MPRTRVLLAARAVMWFGVVAHDAMPCRGDSRWKATCLQSTSVPPARPHSTPNAQRDEPSVPSATVLVPTPTEKQAFTITDREVMTTWILTPNQSATLAAHPWRIRFCIAVTTKAEGHKKFSEVHLLCNKRRRCTSGMSPLPGRKTANLERVRRIPSHTWRPRPIAKSTLDRNRSTEIQKQISVDMRCQKRTSRLRHVQSNLHVARAKKHLR